MQIKITIYAEYEVDGDISYYSDDELQNQIEREVNTNPPIINGSEDDDDDAGDGDLYYRLIPTKWQTQAELIER